MGLGKTYSADYLIDSNGNTGVSGQVLISTATGIDWADGTAITGGPFLPLSAGSSYPLTNSLYLENTSGSAGASPSLYFKNGSGNFWRYLHESGGDFSIKEGTATRLTFKAGGHVGIGTTSPGRTLSVETNDTATYSASVNASEISVARKNSSNTAGQVAAISLNATGWSGQTTGVVVLNAIARQGNFSNADFAIQNRVGGNFVETFRITTYGNVGIGTDTPDDNVNTGAYFKPDGGGRFLTVKDSAGSFIMLESSTTTDDDQIGGIYFNNTGGQADAHVHVAGIDAILHKHGTNDALSGGDLRFFTKPSGSGVAGPRMIILQNGNVGIGTAGPTAKLDVKGDGADFFLQSADYKIARIQPRGTGADLDRGLFSLFNGNTESVRIDTAGNSWLNGGNVGIGLTAPDAPLHILRAAGGANIVTGLKLDPDDATTGSGISIDFNASTTNTGASLVGSRIVGAREGGNASGFLALYTSPDASGSVPLERMRIDSTGNVGIGNTSPQNTLHLGDNANASAGTLRIDSFVANQFWKLEPGTNTFSIKDYDGTSLISFDGANNYALFPGGYVGIGTTAPGRPLTVNSDTAHKAIRILENDTGNESWDIGVDVDGDLNFFNSADTSPSVTFLDNGNVGIGTTSPGSKLEIHKSITYGSYGPASPQLNLVNTHTERTAGFLMLSARYNNTSPAQTFYPVGGIGGGKETALANNEWGGYINFFTTSDGTAGAASARFEHMRITADGNVGIGTTNPGQKLHVTGNIKADSGSSSSFVYFGANSKNYLAYDVSNSAYWRTPSVHFFEGDTGFKGAWDGVGQLGIGTTSPRSGYKLTLDKSTNVSGEFVGISIEEAGGTGYGYIKSEDQLTPDTSFVIGHTSRVLTLETASTERVRIDNSGNVGIGTQSMSRKLQVDAAAGYPLSLNSTQQYLMEFARGGVSEWWFAVNNGDFKFHENGVGDQVIIKAGGKVGIGTTSPGYNLTVDNDALNTNNPALYVKNPNSSTAAVIAEFVGDSDSIQIKNIGTGDYAIYNSQQSNGIALFDGNGGVEIRYNGATVLEADSNGGVKVTGQLSATGDVVAYSSDERLKENIKPIESAVDKIKQLKGVTFDWNEKSEELGFEPSTKTNDVGVIAQDVEAVFPQLVQLAPFDIGSDEDGKATSKSGEDYKTVNYARLTAVLIEAVKEQQQQIDELKAKLDGITK